MAESCGILEMKNQSVQYRKGKAIAFKNFCRGRQDELKSCAISSYSSTSQQALVYMPCYISGKYYIATHCSKVPSAPAIRTHYLHVNQLIFSIYFPFPAF